MYIVDTDILIWALRGDKFFTDFLSELSEKNVLSISTVTIAEIYKNIFPSEILKTEKLIQEFKVLDVTMPVAKQAGFYYQQYHKKLLNLGIIDCLIAATAHSKSATLVTLNTKHYPMKEIKIKSPHTH